MATIEEQLDKATSEERDRLEKIEQMNQDQRLKRMNRAKNVARLGALAAFATGNEGLGEVLHEGSRLAKEGGEEGHIDPGMIRRAGANYAGKIGGKAGRSAANKLGQNAVNNAAKAGQQAGNLAGKAAAMGGGSEAAMAGAIAGAVRGEGVGGIVKSSLSSVILWFWFGFLTLGVITSPAVVPILLALVAVAYLDFHFMMSKFGFKIFGSMNLLQKGILFVANLIVMILPLMFIGMVYALPCASSTGYYALKAAHIVSLGLIQDVCGTATQPSFAGGRSGGAGATGTFGEIDIVLSGAYRPGAIVFNTNRLSAHGRGEAFDVALRNPRVPFRPNPPDPRINQLISIGKSLVGSKGDVIDEYNNPKCDPGAQTCAGHIHVEFNSGQCDGTGQPLVGPPTDLVDLNGLVPIGGATTPKVRQCMLSVVLGMFEMAGQTKISETTPGVETGGAE
ncbi:MAG: hypothetical protein KW804_02380 [Candidatus Doudnabacteria bacterium]|nr:hypothetical protein [Candidatus Doudnabacteria bacterium]